MSTTNDKGIKANPTADSSIDQDSLHGILSNSRRRHIIESLATFDQLDLGDTAEQIASIEQDKPVPDLSRQERKRVYIGLYQSHLPKLDRVDVVDWDKNRGTIEPGPIHRVAYDAMRAAAHSETEPDSLIDRVRRLLPGEGADA